MIIDSLANSDKYVSLHPRFAKAFDFIKSQNLDNVEVGKYPIDGPELHASVSSKDGVGQDEAKREAHNNFIDIQVSCTSGEGYAWKDRSNCVAPKGDYNSEKDVIFYADKPDTFFTLQAGQFAIFYPEDMHAAGMGEGTIKKLVVKVKL